MIDPVTVSNSLLSILGKGANGRIDIAYAQEDAQQHTQEVAREDAQEVVLERAKS